jgi:hypothetical protein
MPRPKLDAFSEWMKIGEFFQRLGHHVLDLGGTEGDQLSWRDMPNRLRDMARVGLGLAKAVKATPEETVCLTRNDNIRQTALGCIEDQLVLADLVIGRGILPLEDGVALQIVAQRINVSQQLARIFHLTSSHEIREAALSRRMLGDDQRAQILIDFEAEVYQDSERIAWMVSRVGTDGQPGLKRLWQIAMHARSAPIACAALATLREEVGQKPHVTVSELTDWRASEAGKF